MKTNNRNNGNDESNRQPLERDLVNSSLVVQLSGYLELGMPHEARRLTRKILAKRNITAAEFSAALTAIGITARRYRTWKQSIETAYQRLNARAKREVRPDMLAFYNGINDVEKAAEFVPGRSCASAADAMFAMEILLQTGDLKRAERLSKFCWKALIRETDEFYQSCFIDALASYHARCGNLGVAEDLWKLLPVEQPMARQALLGIVNTHLAQALAAVRRGLEAVEQRKASTDLDLEIMLPGNEDGITAEIERDLLSLMRKLEKILPPERQKDFGIVA